MDITIYRQRNFIWHKERIFCLRTRLLKSRMVEKRRKQCDCKLLSYLAAAPSLAGLIIKFQDVYFHGDVFLHVVFTVNAFHVKNYSYWIFPIASVAKTT